MIDEIRVDNVALIRQASLMPSSGLTVLTGETGAGKTALLSALKLLIGARSDKDQVRDGEDALSVSGRFYLAHRANSSQDEGVNNTTVFAQDYSEGEEELVVTRRVGRDGRSRVSINGSMASVSELAERVAPSIDLCGQHEHQKLLKSSTHGELLDAWAATDIAPLKECYQAAFQAAQDAAAELSYVLDAQQDSSAQVEQARFVLKQIDAVNPVQGEYEELLDMLSKAEHAESLASAANGVHEALAGDEGALDKVNEAVFALDNAARFDEALAPFASSLRETIYVLEDVAAETRTYRDALDFNAEILGEMQERMAALQGLLRSHGPRMADVFEAREKALETVSLVDDADFREKAARKAVEKAETQLAEAAEHLQAARQKKAPAFAQAVTAQMQRLEMAGCELVCTFTPLERNQWTKAGSASLEFEFCPGAGMRPRPLSRIASGGEVSRVMLAIKVVQGETDNVDTLVFDEVDAGVGGSTARALGEVLATLAQTHQVVVVTHLPQVAVWAQLHYVVQKTAKANAAPETQLRVLNDSDRVAEIARMLSGDTTKTSLAHAKELLASAVLKQ